MAEERGGEVRDEKDLKFGGGGETIDGLRADEDVNKQDSNGLKHFKKSTSIGGSSSSECDRLCTNDNVENLDSDGLDDYKKLGNIPDNWAGLGKNKNMENLDFGRDTNRLDYFRVTSFDFHGDEGLRGIASYGGGGDRTRQVPVGIFANNFSGGGGSPKITPEKGRSR